MLIRCPECDLQVSDQAIACPHCGYIINTARKTNVTTSKKRKRLPNGFGQISEVKNKKLRNRYRAMVTIGKNDQGRPIVKPLKPTSFFQTYNEAYQALAEYNKNPYDLSPSISVKELYKQWTNAYFQTLSSDSSRRTIESAWAYCGSVYGMRVIDLKARHIKGCIENGTANIKGEIHVPSAGTKSRIKSMFNLMLDYALEYEIVTQNYARTFNLSDDIEKEKEKMRRGHIPFTDAEMQKLWDNLYKVPYVDIVLIQCYSGWRPQELGLIRLCDVDLEQDIFAGGMKTDAGKDRIVPIHSKIKELVKKRYNEAVSIGSEYLFNCTDAVTHRSEYKLTYDKYRQRFLKIVRELGLNAEHRAHDGRMQFITRAIKYSVDEYAIKYIVGHAINDVTEKVYTKREIDWLKSEIEKIKF